MSFRPRHLLIRWVLPRAWSLSERQRVRVLLEFAQTELDSAWQSVFALQKVRDPGLRPLLLQHAFEELFHSDLFMNMASRKSSTLAPLPLTRREPLMEFDGGDRRSCVEFLAFLAVGESEIREDFEVYGRAIPDADVRALFARISKDEAYHAEGSSEALTALAGQEGLSLFRIRFRHLLSLAGKRYVSVMGKFGTLPMTALLFLSWLLFGWIFRRQAGDRLAAGQARELELLRLQQRRFLDSLGGKA